MNKIGYTFLMALFVSVVWLFPTTDASACGCSKRRRVGNKMKVACNPKMGCKAGSCGCGQKSKPNQRARIERMRAFWARRRAFLARRRVRVMRYPDGPVCREPKKIVKVALKKVKVKKKQKRK